ncbi:hypothetical protein SAMD00019534_073990, partial [Acytostelium subglobosum LB1]|uniref:hypothetical protein n=1 Tax=Acytostelium subglobosum LB1 TaxID=1410327 RepID=UPI000645108D
IKRITKEQAWDIRHIVMYPDHPRSFIMLELDDEPSTTHFGLYADNDQLVSVVSLFIDDHKQEAQFRKFATLEQHQRRGYGTTLLRHMIEHTVQLGIKRLFCNARANKQSFYNSFGLQSKGDTWDKNGYTYCLMEMNL